MNKKIMEKVFDPTNIEKHWYEIWEHKNYFAPQGNGTPYCIMIPPPNITGRLHMGHGFQLTLMDALIRYHRMSDDKTLWQIGTDHAGIATQIVVERELQKENKTRHDLGRDDFVKRIYEWKKQSGGRITQQLRRLGASVDWSRERFTMDEGLSQAVQEVFIRLYEEGLIYRGKRLVNWDPKLKTAISDLEVVSSEEDGQLWFIRYPLLDEKNNATKDHIIVATTRPETMLGDVAVAVHPDDKRYQHLIGHSLQLPLTDRHIPIIADDYVDPTFGTGCVKITPAHDFNDYVIGQRHELPLINIFTPDAYLNDSAPKKYCGQERFDARKNIVNDLKEKNLIEKIEAYKIKIPKGDRSGVVIEPYLTDQWFVKTESLAKPAIDAVKKGDIKFVPSNWSKTYFQWMENIEDWCISRQLWWGHRIPAWYDNDKNIYVGQNEKEIREKYKLDPKIKLTQDNDVLDTWFSSSLWPFSTLGWPKQTKELNTYYPTDVLVTGFDIIFFWVARMIMMGLKFTGQIPFSKVYITGLIRDAEGQKMSKSKGNVLDPIDLIDGIELEALITERTRHLLNPAMEKSVEQGTRKQFPHGIPPFGTDALRFTFCALASTGRDIRFDLDRIQGYRNFCNKLWNASRYVLMNTEDKEINKTINFENEIDIKNADLNLADRWILSRLQTVIEKTHQHFSDYRFDLLAQALYEFTWNEFCDWYLELSKPVLYDTHENLEIKNNTRQTLIYVLETLLRLLHPVMPFITEEIWQRVAPLEGKNDDTIMLQTFPKVEKAWRDKNSEDEIEWIKQVITGIRTIRSEMNIAPSKFVDVLLHKGNSIDQKRLSNNQQFLMSLAKLGSITWLDTEKTPPPSATALASNMEILIPMAGLIDKDAEMTRLKKEITKLQKEYQRSENKLNNPNYVAKAPTNIVEKEKKKLDELKIAFEKLEKQLEKIENL